MDGQEKKHFNFPKREELIEQIKELDDQIEHVSLNLIKCDFNATEKDVEKTFPEFTFVKVKNYNPGSFEVVFEMKIDAINFIRNCFDRKILARRFFIKLGRQHKEVVEDWACVGYVPKKFNNKHQNKHNQNKERKPHHKEDKKEVKEGEKEEKEQKVQQKKTQTVAQKKQVPKKSFDVPIPEKKQYNKGQKNEKKKQNKQEKQDKKKQVKESKPEVKAELETKEQKGQDDEGWISVPKKGKKR